MENFHQLENILYKCTDHLSVECSQLFGNSRTIQL